MADRERLINHGRILGAYRRVNGRIAELEQLRQRINNMGEVALGGWEGQSAEVFAQVNKENDVFFGALIQGVRNLNEGLKQADSDFEATDSVLRANMGG